MKNSRNRIILFTILLIVSWNIAAWFIAQSYFQSRIEDLVKQESGLAQNRASDLADSINRNLSDIHGLPELFSQEALIINVLSRFGGSTSPSVQTPAINMQRWSRDPELIKLNQFLSRVETSLHADLIYVVNAAGDCIAASNSGTRGSPVGTNFAERDFFRMNRKGKPGSQYAVGKTTHIAGLYFSSPVMVGGKFMGAIVSKIDVPSLSFLITKTNAFVSDENGVIILSHDKELEMSALAGKAVTGMAGKQKVDRYRRNDFPELSVSSWGDTRFPELLRFHNKKIPYLLAEEKVGDYGLTVHVASEMHAVHSLTRDSYWFAFLLGLVGSVLILIDNGVALYLGAIRKSRAQLQEQKNQLETFLHAAQDGIHVLDSNNKLILVNDAFCRMMGYTREEMLGMNPSQWDANNSEERLREIRSRVMEQGVLVFETMRRRKDGQIINVEISAVVVEVNGQKLVYCAERDISERKHIEEELNLASLVLKNSSDGMVVTDESNRIIAINPACTSITGYSLEEVKGKDPKIFGSGKHDKSFYEKMWRSLAETGRWQGEIWDKHKNGEIQAKWLTINAVLNADGSMHRHVALFSDITQRKQSEELIWKQANFDTLTELPNRRMFLDRLQVEAKKLDRSRLTLALLLIDLDQFKEVNDTLGHAVGDNLLKEAARRILSCVRDSDTVARLGGDEFTVILSGLADSKSVENITQKIIDKLAEPFYLEDEIVYISASVGITLYPNDADNIDELMKNADQAMYVSKKNGRNRFSYYTHSLQDAAQKRLRMTTDLRKALAEHQFRIEFQPIVELASGRIFKAEALLRWYHPEQGVISPMEFIPLAEETGLIHSIGDWVFKQAAHWSKRWSSMYGADFQISVNKSPIQFRLEGNGFSGNWAGYLQELGLSGKNLVVEITEGLLLNAEANVTDKLLGFRDIGIQVAIDDFGTGYSSLSYLKKFDIDYLKIDQSFVRNLSTDEDDVALCEAIIVMAHKLGLKVIAEGVETVRQRVILEVAGCDYAQGYLFSKPVTPEELEKLLSLSDEACFETHMDNTTELN